MEVKTKWAAVMVTDIVGYSSLMFENTGKAMSILEKNRKIHKSLIRQFKGTFIKEVGDGILSMYENSVDAVKCAMEIQKTCCREASLQLRIGIHAGNVVIRYSDIIGSGVNIASFIESAGIPGGIYLSERVYQDVKDKMDVFMEFFTEKKLKDLPQTVKIFTIPTEYLKNNSTNHTTTAANL